MNFLAMHLANRKLHVDIYWKEIYKYLHGTLSKNSSDFWHKRKIDNSDPYNVLLATATNIHVGLKTGFVAQGHR